MSPDEILAFAGVAVLLTVTPGVDMALVGRHALRGGSAAGVGATCGVATGLLVWAVASAAGVAAVLAASAAAYEVLRVAGVVVLVALGVRTWRAAGHGAPVDPAAVGRTGPPAPTRRGAFAAGLSTNLVNPKIVVFYAAVLPGFVPDDASLLGWSLVLAGIHAGLSLAWLAGYALLLARARAFFARPRVARTLDRLTGAALVGLGVRLALDRR